MINFLAISYDEFYNFGIVLIAIVGLLLIIDKAIDLVKKYKKPGEDLKATVEEHERLIKSASKEFIDLKTDIKETNKVQNKALLQIMNHMIDGNHVDKLKESRDDMETYLINH